MGPARDFHVLSEVQAELDQAGPSSPQPTIAVDLDPPATPAPARAPSSPHYTPYRGSPVAPASPSPNVSPTPDVTERSRTVACQTGGFQITPSDPPPSFAARVMPLEPSTPYIWVHLDYRAGPNGVNKPMYIFNKSTCSWDLACIFTGSTSPF